MITITPASPAEQTAALQREGMPEGECLILRDGTQPAGYALYIVEEKNLELLAVRAADGLFLEGLVRAALHAGELAGASTAVGGSPDMAAFLERLGFRREGETLSVSIPEFFSRPCGGGG